MTSPHSPRDLSVWLEKRRIRKPGNLKPKAATELRKKMKYHQAPHKADKINKAAKEALNIGTRVDDTFSQEAEWRKTQRPTACPPSRAH
jgi:hypothetical protein